MVFGRLAGAGLCPALLWAAVAATFAAPSPSLAQQLVSVPANHAAKPAARPKVETTPTRLIIHLERRVEFELSALHNPNRIYVDLPEVRLVLPDALGDTPVGLIKSFRHGGSAPGKTRVVIDVTGPVVVEKSDIEAAADGKSARLTIDIISAAEATAADEA